PAFDKVLDRVHEIKPLIFKVVGRRCREHQQWVAGMPVGHKRHVHIKSVAVPRSRISSHIITYSVRLMRLNNMRRAVKAFQDKGFFGQNQPNFPTERAVFASLISMKKAFCLAAILLAVSAAFSQVKPLTQTEYVKMLYDLQKAPQTKGDI